MRRQPDYPSIIMYDLRSALAWLAAGLAMSLLYESRLGPDAWFLLAVVGPFAIAHLAAAAIRALQQRRFAR